MPTQEILSPMPGVFYISPSPDSPPFFEEGASIGANAVVGIVELMKQFTEIQASEAGTGLKYLVEDGAEVDADQVIATYEVL